MLISALIWFGGAMSGSVQVLAGLVGAEVPQSTLYQPSTLFHCRSVAPAVALHPRYLPL